jgi:hypothetical protein
MARDVGYPCRFGDRGHIGMLPGPGRRALGRSATRDGAGGHAIPRRAGAGAVEPGALDAVRAAARAGMSHLGGQGQCRDRHDEFQER